MDSKRFDRFTRFLATSSTRRAALATGAGSAAAVLASKPVLSAVQATPDAGSASVATPTFLYVQNFEAGTLAPLADQTGYSLLTLTGAPPSTIVFADHPARQTNILATERLPEALSFDAANPPNAALVTRTDGGEEIVLVVELLEPTYDPATHAVTYKVIELSDYSSVGDEFASRAQPLDAMPASFGLTSLFIDSGGDGSCRGSLEVCNSDDECCDNFLCIPTTCTPDDGSQTSFVSSDLGMCLAALG